MVSSKFFYFPFSGFFPVMLSAVLCVLCPPLTVFAAEANTNQATFFLAPRSETVLAGSTFEVSVFLNTRGNSINAIDLNLKFSRNLLTAIKPSTGTSIISLWVEPPTYSNTDGVAHFTGVIPNGVTTESGLVTTLTFKAEAAGQATIEILPSSKILANDGLGSSVLFGLDRGVYRITPRPPDGVKVFSETHPFENIWYNNNNPVLTWEKSQGITDFSFVLDNKPVTVPDDAPDTHDTITSHENVSDGLWYFHIKARKDGVWGVSTHFVLHIDTAPPAAFQPKVEVLSAALIRRALVSFFTTDALSGVDHYEVGVIDKAASPLTSPVFVQTESPYQLPFLMSKNVRMIVRAVDRAGNVRDESMDIALPASSWIFTVMVLTLLAAIVLLHYLFGHKIINRLREAIKALKKNEQ